MNQKIGTRTYLRIARRFEKLLAADNMKNAILLAEWLGLLESDGHCNFSDLERHFNMSWRHLFELSNDRKFNTEEISLAYYRQILEKLEDSSHAS